MSFLHNYEGTISREIEYPCTYEVLERFLLGFDRQKMTIYSVTYHCHMSDHHTLTLTNIDNNRIKVFVLVRSRTLIRNERDELVPNFEPPSSLLYYIEQNKGATGIVLSKVLSHIDLLVNQYLNEPSETQPQKREALELTDDERLALAEEIFRAMTPGGDDDPRNRRLEAYRRKFILREDTKHVRHHYNLHVKGKFKDTFNQDLKLAAQVDRIIEAVLDFTKTLP